MKHYTFPTLQAIAREYNKGGALLYEIRALNPAVNRDAKSEDRATIIGYVIYDPERNIPLRENAKSKNGWKVITRAWNGRR